MKDVFQMILADRSVSELLPALADVQPDSLAEHAIKLSDNDNSAVVTWLSQTLRGLGVRSTLYAGAIFYVAKQMDEALHGNATLELLYTEIGISRTQAYRAIQVFEVFNPLFQENSILINQFVSESLKILAEEQTCESARTEAIRQAKSGTRISIRIAKSLQTHYSLSIENDSDLKQPWSTDKDSESDQSDGNRNKKSKKHIEQSSEVEIQQQALLPDQAQNSIAVRGNSSATDAILFEGYGFRLVVEPELAHQSGGELQKIVEGLEQFLEQLRSQVRSPGTTEASQP